MEIDTCDVCNKKSVEAVRLGFWDQRCCPGHYLDGTLRCDTCSNLKKAGETEYLNLGDGRNLCSDCSSIAIMNQEECNAIIENVFEFYRSLNLKVDESIPILFLDRNDMRKIMKDHTLGCFFSSAEGFILTIEEYLKTRGNIEVLKKVPKLLEGGAAVVVLFGKPDVEMGGILAHEMMHAWLHLQGKPWEWERSVEEGICQVMNYKWLEWFCSGTGFNSWYKTNDQAQHARNLKEFLALWIERTEDKVYGQGFRDALRAVRKLGLKTTLDHTLKNGTLPAVPAVPDVHAVPLHVIPPLNVMERHRHRHQGQSHKDILWDLFRLATLLVTLSCFPIILLVLIYLH